MELSKIQHDKIISYFQSKPVLKAYVFGSYARGQADENSDIDLLVELDPPHNPGIAFFGYQTELESILGRKVDLAVEGALSKYVQPIINAEKKIIYERSGG